MLHNDFTLLCVCVFVGVLLSLRRHRAGPGLLRTNLPPVAGLGWAAAAARI